MHEGITHADRQIDRADMFVDIQYVITHGCYREIPGAFRHLVQERCAEIDRRYLKAALGEWNCLATRAATEIHGDPVRRRRYAQFLE